MSSDSLKGLSSQQVRFVTAYAASGNATQSAITAGYSAKTAYSSGGRLLKSVEIQLALAHLLDPSKNLGIAVARETQEYWTSIMRDEPDSEGNYPTILERLRASELLARAQGQFIVKVEVKDDPNVGIAKRLKAAAERLENQ